MPFFSPSLWAVFVAVILELEARRERRRNNLAIFRETFSLPYFENDVMSENLQRARQIVYVIPKLFFFSSPPQTLLSINLNQPGPVLHSQHHISLTEINALVWFLLKAPFLLIWSVVSAISCICWSPVCVCVSSTAALPSIIMNILFKPYQRGVYCNDESIMYPLKPDTITHGMLAAVTISCTVIIVSLTPLPKHQHPLFSEMLTY